MSKEAANDKLRKMLYESRSCGECDACCTGMEVTELNKPAGTRCSHLKDGDEKGCSIYEARPEGCRQWACAWRMGSDIMRPHERPDKIGVFIDVKSHLILFAKETEPGGFVKAKHVLERLARKRVVVVLEADGMQGVGFGPSDRMGEYVDFMHAYNKAMKDLVERRRQAHEQQAK